MNNSDKDILKEIKKGQTGTGLLIENEGFISLDYGENKLIKEDMDKQGNEWKVPYPFRLKTVFQKFGIKNANGRVYPENVLKHEVAKYQEKIKERSAYGELNHPNEATIDLGRLCFLITELHWEEHTLVGEIEIPISYGFMKSGIISSLADLLAQWIISGLKIGVSSRGLGSVKNVMGQQVVDDDYEIECWDAVSDPSTPGAYICPNGDVRQYVESDTTNKNKPKLSEKIDKALKILK
jgi:hypothetical protein